MYTYAKSVRRRIHNLAHFIANNNLAKIENSSKSFYRLIYHFLGHLFLLWLGALFYHIDTKLGSFDPTKETYENHMVGYQKDVVEMVRHHTLTYFSMLLYFIDYTGVLRYPELSNQPLISLYLHCHSTPFHCCCHRLFSSCHSFLCPCLLVVGHHHFCGSMAVLRTWVLALSLFCLASSVSP